MRKMKNMFMMLASLVCAAGYANAEELGFVEPKQTLTDFILGNQPVILAIIVVLGSIGLAWLALIGIRGQLNILGEASTEIERELGLGPPEIGPIESRAISVYGRLHRFLHRIRGPLIGMILVIGTAIAFLLWKSDAKVLDETNGLPTPQPLGRRLSAKAAVVFIHGWKGDDTSWQQFPKLATQDDRLQEADIYIVNYPTYMMKRNSSVGGLANWLWQDFFTGTLIPKYSEIHIIALAWGA